MQDFQFSIYALIKLNIQVRQDTQEFLTVRQQTFDQHVIAFDIDWSWNIFCLHIFQLNSYKQVIDLRKVR